MTRITLALVAVVTLFVVGVQPAAAQLFSSGPGKQFAIATNQNINLGTPTSVTIAKGKKHGILVITTTANFPFANVTNSVCLGSSTTVQGSGPAFSVIPSPGFPYCTDCSSGSCSVTAQQWFNIDDGESFFPGKFVGQPLTITVNPGGTVGNLGEVTLEVRMEKP
jgi:hypothetical protein